MIEWKHNSNKNWYMINSIEGVIHSRNKDIPLTATIIKSENKIIISFLVGSIAKRIHNNIETTQVSIKGGSDMISITLGVPMVNGELIFEGVNFTELDMFIKEYTEYSQSIIFSARISSRIEFLEIEFSFTGKGYPILD